jgi:hypothetical protein
MQGRLGNVGVLDYDYGENCDCCASIVDLAPSLDTGCVQGSGTYLSRFKDCLALSQSTPIRWTGVVLAKRIVEWDQGRLAFDRWSIYYRTKS